jgi:hypothetical protein
MLLTSVGQLTRVFFDPCTTVTRCPFFGTRSSKLRLRQRAMSILSDSRYSTRTSWSPTFIPAKNMALKREAAALEPTVGLQRR